MLFLPQLIAIAVVQGITEFLPISSSGHLVLVPHLTGWTDHGIVYDVAAHFGTLIAVVFYFRQDLTNMTVHWYRHVRGGPVTEHSTMAWAVGWGTIPVSVAGLLLHDVIAENLRSPIVIAVTTIVFGVGLWLADHYGRRDRTNTGLKWTDVLIIGMAQALALIPGTSRSGITMTAGLALGFTRTAAARFSFLLSIPVILLATGYETWHLVRDPLVVDWVGLIAVIIGAAVSAFACIALFLRFLDRVGMLPFVIYRLILGVVLLVIFYTW